MTFKIKLMADYGCHPLWWAEDDTVGNINPKTLPLSEKMVQNLEEWATIYNHTLNWDDPANSPGFVSEADRKRFEAKGINLWKQLRKELADNYEVLYFSERLHKLLSNPVEIELML